MSTKKFKIVLNGKEEATASIDQTLVDALGEKMPYGCKSGGCGRCKVLVVKGEVTHPKLSAIALMPDKVEDGYVLGCQTKPLSDLELDC